MKPETMIRFKPRARIIKAIVYAKRIFIVIEMRNGKKHHVMELAKDQYQTKSSPEASQTDRETHWLRGG